MNNKKVYETACDLKVLRDKQNSDGLTDDEAVEYMEKVEELIDTILEEAKHEEYGAGVTLTEDEDDIPF